MKGGFEVPRPTSRLCPLSQIDAIRTEPLFTEGRSASSGETPFIQELIGKS